MKDVFFKTSFDYRLPDDSIVCFAALSNMRLEEDVAARAVASGCAEYQAFAEDDLFETMEFPDILPVSEHLTLTSLEFVDEEADEEADKE